MQSVCKIKTQYWILAIVIIIITTFANLDIKCIANYFDKVFALNLTTNNRH